MLSAYSAKKRSTDASISARSPLPDSLADHRTLLARDREQIGFGVGRELAPERHVQVLPRPAGTLRCAVAKLEVLDAERSREVDRGVDERPLGVRVARGRSAVDAERQRHERVAEEAALHLRERENAGDLAAALGQPIVRPMAEVVLEDAAPADAVEERRLRAAPDECVPPLGVTRREVANDEGCGSAPEARHRFRRDPHHSPPFRKIRSTRSHRKSATSRRRRDSICPRLT